MLIKILLTIAVTMLLTSCILPDTSKFKYVGWHKCDPERTIPMKPLTPSFCFLEEVK